MGKQYSKSSGDSALHVKIHCHWWGLGAWIKKRNLGGGTNHINVDRMNLLETTFEEGALENLRLTLEVSLYGEVSLLKILVTFTTFSSFLLKSKAWPCKHQN